MSMRVTMTIGLAAAVTTVSLLAHAETTLHQDGFQYSGGSVRYKPVETFLLGEAPRRARLTTYTPQTRPSLSVRMSESPASPNLPVAPAENPAVSAQTAPVTTKGTSPAAAKVESTPKSPPPPVKSEEPAAVTSPVEQPSAPVQAPPPTAASRQKIDKPVTDIPAEPQSAVVNHCGAQTLRFKWASTWVHPKSGKALVNALKSCGARQLVVTGYTCDLGNKQVNDRMALGRAEEVAKILRRAGFEVIEVSGKGKSDYVDSNPTHREDNRRVEVTLASSS